MAEPIDILIQVRSQGAELQQTQAGIQAVTKSVQESSVASQSLAEWWAKGGANIVDTTIRETAAVAGLKKEIQETAQAVNQVDFSKLGQSLATGGARGVQAKPPRLALDAGGMQDISAEAEDAAAKILDAEGKVAGSYRQTSNELRLLGGLARLVGADRVSSELRTLNVIQSSTAKLGLMGTTAAETEGLVASLGGATMVMGVAMVAAYVAAAAAAATVVVKLIEWAKATADLTLKHEASAQALRITTQVYGELLHAGSAVGIGQDKLASGLKSLSEWMLRTGRDGQPLEEVLARQADRLNAIEDPAQRAREAFLLFGEASQEMGLLVSKGGAGIEQLRQGTLVAFGPQAVANAREYKIAVADLDEQWQAFKNAASEDVIPALTGIVKWLALCTQGTRDLVDLLGGETIKAIATIAMLGPGGSTLYNALQAAGRGDPEENSATLAPARTARGSRPEDLALGAGKDTLELERQQLERGREQVKFSYDQRQIDLESYLGQRRLEIDLGYTQDTIAAQQAAQGEENIEKAAQIQKAGMDKAEETRQLALLKLREEGIKEKERLEKEATDELIRLGDEELRAHLRNAAEERRQMVEEHREKLDNIAEERAALETDYTKSTKEKRLENLALLQEELDLINEQVTALHNKALAESDPAAADQYENAAGAAQGHAKSLQIQVTKAQGENDPENWAQQWSKTLDQLQTQFGGWAQQTAHAFADVFNTAIASISDGITGLIMGTKTWGQALLQIGTTVLTTLVKDIVEMGVRWLMTHVLMQGVSMGWKAFQTSMRTADVAESNATELAKTPALGANALLASIGSWGIAVVLGLAAIAGILAATGAFADGGMVAGAGGPRDDKILARVSNGEFIVNAQATSQHRDLLEQINSGGGVGGVSASGPTINVSGSPTRIIVVPDIANEVMRAMESERGHATVHRIVRRGRTDIGVGT